MMGIPDLTDTQFDDEKLFRQVLTETLRKLDGGVGANVASTSVDFPYGLVFYIVDDPSVVIPKGYKKADGKSGTFDVTNRTLIPIQRV